MKKLLLIIAIAITIIAILFSKWPIITGVTLFLVVAIGPLGFIVYYRVREALVRLAGERHKPFAAVPENTFAVKQDGGDATRAIENIDGWVVVRTRDNKDWRIVPDNWPDASDIHPDDPQAHEDCEQARNHRYIQLKQQPWFQGLYYVGIFPGEELGVFTIDMARWSGDKAINHETKGVRYFRHRPERRAKLVDLELADGHGVAIHLYVEVILRLRLPLVFLYLRTADYGIIDAGLKAVFSSFVLRKKSTDFSGERDNKGKIKKGKEAKPLDGLFPQDKILRQLRSNPFVESSGFTVESFTVTGFDPNDEFKKLLEKARQVAEADHNLRITKKKVEGETHRMDKVLSAISAKRNAFVAQSKADGGDPTQASHDFADIVNVQAHAAGEFKQPHIPRGSGAVPIINPGSNP